jgi:colanic acid/amylovoran biosynthesis glycosyltransferase
MTSRTSSRPSTTLSPAEPSRQMIPQTTAEVGADPIRVVQYSPIWLERTEVWLYDQVTALPPSVTSHVAAESTVNEQEFPIENLHVLRDRGLVPYLWDRGMRRLRVRDYCQFLLKIVRDTDADVLHSHFGTTGWEARRVAERLGVPHVVTFYGYDLSQMPQTYPIWRERYAELFATVARVLCEGPHMASRIVDLGCPADKVGVHRLGLPIERYHFRPRSRDSEPLRILIASSFREKKGIPYAVAAAGRLAQLTPVEVTIVGGSDGSPASREETARIHAAIRDAQLGDRVRMLGFLSHDALFDELYKQQVLLAASVHAADGDAEGGAPFTILEAAATGMPVVSTKHCDIPYILRDGADLLADERDVDGLVDRLRWLVENPWDELVARIRRRLEQEHSATTQGQLLADLYGELSDHDHGNGGRTLHAGRGT